MREAGKETLFHPILPVWDARSRVLILGSFPSAKSRAAQFFYGNPQNRFWRVLAAVLACPPPETTTEKKALLLAHGVALWDVIASCEITGSSDASIKNVTANDISVILENAPIERIFVNGGTAAKMYARYTEKAVGRPAVCLPSTSPANAAWSLERLIKAWSVIAEPAIRP